MPVELPNVLAFERKLEVSDALMHAGDWETRTTCDWKKIPLTTRHNRSTKGSEGTKATELADPNPASGGSDDANLFQETDTLRVTFSLRVIGNLGSPFSCNSPEFVEALSSQVSSFKESDNLHTLSQRYAYNIANGRFLWRNRVGAEEAEVHVQVQGKEAQIYNAYDYSLQNFEEGLDHVSGLAKEIAKGLKADANNCTFIEVTAYVKLGMGQHVFPSELMLLDKSKGDKSKNLFQLEDCAAMHSVKIGNALRTVDNWHGDKDGMPIAAEPFGAVTQRGKAYRPSKNDLYTLLVKWVNDTELSNEDQCYVIANLIRGGLFQKNS